MIATIMDADSLSTDAKPAKSEPAHKIAAEDAEDAPEVAAPVPSAPRKGVYVLEQGDSPASVSTKLFGRGQFAVAIARANPGCDWAAGSTITLP